MTSWEIIIPAAQGPNHKFGVKGCWDANWSAKQERFCWDSRKKGYIIAITLLAWLLPTYRIQHKRPKSKHHLLLLRVTHRHSLFSMEWKSLPKDLYCGNKALGKENKSYRLLGSYSVQDQLLSVSPFKVWSYHKKFCLEKLNHKICKIAKCHEDEQFNLFEV